MRRDTRPQYAARPARGRTARTADQDALPWRLRDAGRRHARRTGAPAEPRSRQPPSPPRMERHGQGDDQKADAKRPSAKRPRSASDAPPPSARSATPNSARGRRSSKRRARPAKPPRRTRGSKRPSGARTPRRRRSRKRKRRRKRRPQTDTAERQLEQAQAALQGRPCPPLNGVPTLAVQERSEFMRTSCRSVPSSCAASSARSSAVAEVSALQQIRNRFRRFSASFVGSNARAFQSCYPTRPASRRVDNGHTA